MLDGGFTRGVTPRCSPRSERPTRTKSHRTPITPNIRLSEDGHAQRKKLSDSGVVGFGTDSGPPARFKAIPSIARWNSWYSRPHAHAGDHRRHAKRAEFLRAKILAPSERGKGHDLIVLGKNPFDDIRSAPRRDGAHCREQDVTLC
jgi:hypothetical protein